jgi:GGDEF domain-containing protein
MDHVHPTTDTKKAAPARPQADDVLSTQEDVRNVDSVPEISKIQSAAAGSLNRKQIIALQRMIGNHETGRLLKRISRQTSDSTLHIQRFAKQSEVRKNQFISSATDDKTISPKQAEELFGMVSGGGGDPVTQSEDAVDYDPTMARAIEQVKNTDEAAFNVNVSIRNLGGLNAILGHNEADKVLSDFSTIINQALEKVGGSVSKFRRGGTELQFIIVGKEVRQSYIEAQLMVAQAAIQQDAITKKLDKISHPKFGNAISEKGTGIRYDIQVIKASQNANEADPAKQGEQAHGRGEKFKNAAQERKEQFMKTAVDKYGLSQSKAASLYATSGADAVDSLTGFDKAADRITTLKNAIEYCQNNQAKGVYVEVDIRNLGGLTKAKGREAADEVFRTLATMTESALMGLKADVSRFRHGGDEFSFILVGADLSLDTVGAALTEAQNKIAAYVNNSPFKDVPHPKHPDDKSKYGTGIIFGLGGISGAKDENVDLILTTADRQVETKKTS